ncbi:MAG: glycosyltransferase family 2 protein [Candidatus Omnitrophota bacterium]|nr:glycosyltransferase family 2 protein [Candidatus Omnitrophota bacterium]
MHNKDKRLSVVIPMHNESGNIEELYNGLIKVQQHFANPFEMIFVNDGSTDSSLDIIKGLASSDKNIKIIDLSRNFGHQIAIKAGLSFALGDAAVVIDADLQDPPELIEKMVNKWQEGYQVVYAIRKNRKEGRLLRFLYAAFYRLLKIMSNTSIPLDAGDFCLLDKSIVKILSSMPETDPFIRGLRSWAGYKQIGVEYDRQERYSGKAKYTFWKLLKLALDGIVSFSDIPLKIAAISGFVVSFFSFLLIIVLFIKRLPISGTTTIAVLILFLGGVQLISIGILGEYIGRIYEQSKRRPLFLVKETVNV